MTITAPYHASASISNSFYSSPSNLAITDTTLDYGCTVGSNTITVEIAGVYRLSAFLNCVYSGTLPAVPVFSFNLNNELFSNQPSFSYDLAYNTVAITMYANTNQLLSFEVIANLPANCTVGIAIINAVGNFAVSSGMLSVCSLQVVSVEEEFN